jgi:dipeptidyl-peptidase-4
MQRHFITAIFIIIATTAFSQKQPLTYDQYFKNNFKGIQNPLPQPITWLDDTKFVMTKNGNKLIVDAKTGKEETSAQGFEAPKLTITDAAFIKGNDLFIKLNGENNQLTFDDAKEINPTMSPDNKFVAYTKNNDLYSLEISTKKENRLTNDGSDVILNGYASWVYMEEILGRSSQYRSFWWSPDSKHIAFFRADDSKVPTYTLTDAPGQHGYVDVIRYPKVGDANPEVKVGIAIPDGGNIVWADFNEHDDQYFGLPYWKPDGKTLLVQWMNRKQNQLKIWEVNPSTGMKTPFLSEEQKTWISLDDEGRRITFLENGKGFIYRSDASGYDHLYYYDMSGKLVNPITFGKYTVTDINFIDEKNSVIYFTARKENTARKDLYVVNFNGKKLQRLTFGEFNHTSISLSPSASYFVTTCSNSETPPKMTLVSNKGNIIKELGDSKGEKLDNTEIAKTELLHVMSDDSLYSLPLKITWPLNMVTGKKYPVLISIYGGPNAGTVMDNWSLTGTQQWYAKEGLIQVAMDHRASGHFGKEGVNYMYHNLGYWEMKDYSTMVKWLIANAQADPSKICITGFSYGGYMSCYALTYGADVFTHGMAGGSVIDWTLYDSHYTERYMGTPKDNPEGYKTSSVLNYADKYKGMLQIVHGIVDENVHLQNSIQLTSKLQDLKKDFEFMTYSGGRHGWPGNKNLHFQNLKTRFIYKYLLEKEVPKEMIK